MSENSIDKFILIPSILLAGFLRLFRLARADMITDAAHYSFRAIGYLDYLSFNTQTSPIVWFNFRPWWSFLSFHDHPPLSFLIQNLFFKIFGVSTFSARLHSALFGIGSVILVYLLAKKLYGRACGCLSAFILSICNLHVWISRVGYIESVLIFFILLAVYYFVKALEQEKYFVHFGLFLGLSFLCKYTAFFLVPAVFIYLVFQRRDLFKSRKLWVGLLLCLIVFSPVLIYNLKMYQTRGHFDMQFASLFGQDMSDWSNIQRSVSLDILGSLSAIWLTLWNSLSPVVFCLLFIGLVFVLFEYIFGKGDCGKHLLIMLLAVFLTLFFVFTKNNEYFLSVYTPFIAVIIGYFLVRLAGFFNRENKFALICLSVLPVMYVVFFTMNTNLAYQPKGAEGELYSKIRLDNLGSYQLEEFLDKKIGIGNSPLYKFKTLDDLFLMNSEGAIDTNPEARDVFIFDENLNWFVRMWHFRRRIVYQKVFFISSEEFTSISESDQLALRDRYRNFYFIRGANSGLLDSSEYLSPVPKGLEDTLVQKYNLLPVDIIKNPKRETSFKVYQF